MKFGKVTAQVRTDISVLLQSLTVNSYMGNELRHYISVVRQPGSLSLTEAIDFVVAWIDLGTRYCERLLHAPNLHAPLTSYVFYLNADDKQVLSVFHSMVLLSEGEEIDEGGGKPFLFVFRRAHDRYGVFYADESRWLSWVKAEELDARTPMEELIKADKIFFFDGKDLYPVSHHSD